MCWIESRRCRCHRTCIRHCNRQFVACPPAPVKQAAELPFSSWSQHQYMCLIMTVPVYGFGKLIGNGNCYCKARLGEISILNTWIDCAGAGLDPQTA